MKPPPPPPEILTIVDLIGQEATLKLLELHGGARIYIPGKPDGSKLAKDIGAGPAAKLAAHYGHGDLKIPLAKSWRARVYRVQGLSNNDIARKLCISRSAVQSAMRGNDAEPDGSRDDRQVSLF